LFNYLHLLKQWIFETPETKYRYFVETLSSRNKIYLERPGRLNKGCNFEIFIENLICFKNGNDKPPTHEFIIEDLKFKKSLLSSADWDNVINAITKIYTCQSYSYAEAQVASLAIYGESYELVLKLLRWFFIEQDITYWAKSGRRMLYEEILKI
jgi:hypothetical protein